VCACARVCALMCLPHVRVRECACVFGGAYGRAVVRSCIIIVQLLLRILQIQYLYILF